MKPTALFIDESLDTIEREKLKTEIPAYLAQVADIDDEINPLESWMMNSKILPYFSSAFRTIVLVQPGCFHY